MQLASYIFKVVMMLAKFVELVDVYIRRHRIHLFAPHFNRGTLLNLRHRRGKYLVVRMDNKASRYYWLDYFFVKIEDVVSVVTGFPATWNRTCKCSYLFIYLFVSHVFLVVGWLIVFSLFAATARPL